PCIHAYEAYIEAVNDDGVFTVPVDEFDARYSWSGYECPIDVSITRTRLGILDPALSGGRITATQLRTHRFYLYD
ncbi:MAG: hypothetical protein VX589_14275, partial [Myxococcota bacterium]|nr:hypothetical protein [Myxococcota bacterium]